MTRLPLTGGAKFVTVLHVDGGQHVIQDDAGLAVVAVVGLHHPHEDVAHPHRTLVQDDACDG